MYVFECRAECRTHSSIFKVCFILNAELNVEHTARYSRCMFSNAELNVEPIARYSKCVLFSMQSWTSISQLDILTFLVLLVEYRAEYRSHSSIFADYVCQYIAEYRLSNPLPTSQTYIHWRNVPDMVSYPGTAASLNWNQKKKKKKKTMRHIYVYSVPSLQLRHWF